MTGLLKTLQSISTLAALGLTSSPVSAQRDRVVPILYLPADLPFDAARLPLQAQAVRDAQAWYASRTGGFAFRADPLIVQRSRHTFAELAGNDFQNWWPLPAKEFADYGLAWNDSSHIKLLLLAQGAGAWAGADSENGGIENTGDPGSVPRGGLGGLAVIGDSSIAGILAGVCPREGTASWQKPEGGTAWWCNWNTYRGTIAHELGHTFGLPHPDAFTPGFRCDSTVITNMQCHWAWPVDSLLPFEAAHLPSLPVFSRDAIDEWTWAAATSSDGQPLKPLPRDDVPDSILWIDGRGGGTGYMRGYVLETAAGDSSAIFTPSLTGVRSFIADIGVPRGARTNADYRFECGGTTVTGSMQPGQPPLTIEVPAESGCAVTLRVRGILGVGNPRWSRVAGRAQPTDGSTGSDGVATGVALRS
jgi:hypothetical protein